MEKWSLLAARGLLSLHFRFASIWDASCGWQGGLLVLAWQADWAWRSAFLASHGLPELAFPSSLSSLWMRVRKEEQTLLSPQCQGEAGHALVKRPGDRWNGCVPLALTYTMPSMCRIPTGSGWTLAYHLGG